jgi:hypothetical protein
VPDCTRPRAPACVRCLAPFEPTTSFCAVHHPSAVVNLHDRTRRCVCAECRAAMTCDVCAEPRWTQACRRCQRQLCGADTCGVVTTINVAPSLSTTRCPTCLGGFTVDEWLEAYYDDVERNDGHTDPHEFTLLD